MRKPAIGIFSISDRIIGENLLTVQLCYARGADVVYFTKDDINYDTNTINAQVWTVNGFVREVTEFPHYVEFGGGAGDYRKLLADETTIIDDYKLTKNQVSDFLLTTKFAPCIIPTVHTHNPVRVLSCSMMYDEIIIKPVEGARGERINCLKVCDEGFVFTDTEGVVKALNYQDSLNYINELYNGKPLIIQPRMKFLNKDGRIMDFRINVEKNGKGEWSTVFMIARTSRGSIVSNISAGGYVSEAKKTLEIDFGENAQSLIEKFTEIAKDLPPLIEEASQCNMLSLGIDVAVDAETLQSYIIEVNVIPQVHYHKSAYVSTKADYFAYLTKQIHNND